MVTAKPRGLAVVRSVEQAVDLTSLLYVSNSRLAEDRAEQGVKQIVAAASASNKARGLTGALLFTGEHFAQVIEGDRRAIDLLWAKICRDPRHDQVTLVEHTALRERRFADWGMAFYGPSQFVTHHVARLSRGYSPAQFGRTATWLTELLRGV